MKKKLLSAVLAVGLFSGTAAVQAGSIDFSNVTTGFWFDDISQTYTGWFQVNNSLDNSGVVLWTDFFEKDNGNAFDPFLVLWDAAGNKLAFNNDIAQNSDQLDSYINMGQLTDGMYQFTIGNWPNSPVGNNIADGFTALSGSLIPNRGNGEWVVHITGVSVVPEPETWAMLLAGLGIVGAIARRRK
ncbi:MAG: DVUA0089 family protein [Betaproteobacteria bacterium]|nr:DVUA0089 family protein [Betaproteobacteria bacterium]